MGSIDRKSLLSLLALGLFYAMRDLSALMYHVRGKPLDFRYLALAGWLAGILAALFLLPLLIRLCSRHYPNRRKSNIARTLTGLFLAALVIYPFLAPHFPPETLVLQVMHYVAEPFSQSFFEPLALFLFFRCNHGRNTGFFLGLAMALGQLCWLMPLPNIATAKALIASPSPEATAAFLESVRLAWLPFFFRIRLVFAATIAGILFYLLAFPARTASWPRGQAIPETGRAGTARPLLVMFVLFLFLTTAAGLPFFLRIDPSFSEPAFIHVALMAFLPIIGLMADTGEKDFMKPYLIGCTAFFIVASGLALFLPGAFSENLARTLGTLALHTLFLMAVFLCGRVAPYSRHPTLMLMAASLCITLASSSYLLRQQALSLLSVAALPAFLFCSALCLLALFYAFRIFPLPPLVAAAGEEDPGTQPEHALPAAPALKLASFTGAYRLSARETDVMQLLLQGSSTPEMAETLSISENTVKVYVSRILKKTATANRHQFVAFFMQWEKEEEEKKEP
ncbi:helix-turn-helix transcriptional regulator [Oxalobacter sp. OttesenSCG-928-P03]|nr:helix-turn-helix transcriptional regulator [Oxalobacter sp. OttesenSCG-928-P03]